MTPQRRSSDSPVFELTLTDIAAGGYALGRYKGRLVFVPYAIPGETITARVVEDQGQQVYAEGVTLLDASTDRVRPRCPHFGPGRCGGCQWQHIAYEAQLALKTDLVMDALARIGGFDNPPVHLTLASPEQWGYSTQATFFPTPDGGLGFRGARKGQIAPVDECHITRPAVMQGIGELDLDVDNLRELRFQVGDGDAAMIVLRTQDDEPPELESTFPISVNFLLSDNEPFNMVGSTYVAQTILGRPFRVTAGSSFRPNPPQIETLVKLALRYLELQGHEAVLDLYGGVGIFSAFIAPQAGLVTYVDSYPPAVTDAEENLADLDNVDVIEGSVEDILGELLEAEEREHYAAAVVDPPHTGLSEDALKPLAALAIQRLVYISQDPTTLARDAKTLTRRHHYRLIEAQPIDFAPQTANVQCVALFRRESEA